MVDGDGGDASPSWVRRSSRVSVGGPQGADAGVPGEGKRVQQQPQTLGSGLQAVQKKQAAIASKLKLYPSVFIIGGLRWKELYSSELTDALRWRTRYSTTAVSTVDCRIKPPWPTRIGSMRLWEAVSMSQGALSIQAFYAQIISNGIPSSLIIIACSRQRPALSVVPRRPAGERFLPRSSSRPPPPAAELPPYYYQ